MTNEMIEIKGEAVGRILGICIVFGLLFLLVTIFDINPDVEIIGNYTGRHNRILARCRICGYKWEPRASSLLRGSNHKGWKTLHK